MAKKQDAQSRTVTMCERAAGDFKGLLLRRKVKSIRLKGKG